MNTGRWRLKVRGGLIGIGLAVVLGNGLPSVRAAEGDEVEYTFGRPLQKGEQTYDWYRKTHADWAAKRYGVDPKAVGDGMDTWHWWCGADNPGYWREVLRKSGSGIGTFVRKRAPVGSRSRPSFTPANSNPSPKL